VGSNFHTIPVVTASGGFQLLPPRVLVADDDRYLAAMARQTLEDDGITVEVVANGDEALRTADWFRPDVIVLDTMMPIVDGIAALERLRRHEQHQDTPVLMLTSLRTVSDIKRAMASGASGYLTKPFRPDEFLKRVRWLMESPASADPASSGNALVLDT
tara:strand:- start:3 stop:479 length:477 start_codon:yes stop_codon:yes gene_type:complete